MALTRSTPMRRWRWMLMAAAVVAVAVIIVNQNTSATRMRTVALLAISNHLNHLEDHGSLIQATDIARLEQELTSQVGFQVIVPQLDDQLELLGGRKCKLGTRPVAFTLWRENARNYSLFHFQTASFRLPNSIRPTFVQITQPTGLNDEGGAWVWTEGRQGFVLTADPGADIAKVTVGTKSKQAGR